MRHFPCLGPGTATALISAACWLTLGTAGHATGQQPASIAEAGVTIAVVDARTGDPIENARVTVSRTGGVGEPHAGLERLDASRWWFRAGASTEYRVRASAFGYEDAELSVVGATTPRTVTVTLNPSPYELPEIRSTWAREHRTRTVHTLDRRDLALRGNDVGDWLRDLPGFDVIRRSPGGRTVASVRGSRPQAVEVTLDGVPLTDPLTGTADISLVPGSSIERVVAAAGAGGAGWGGSSGTIRLQSRKAEPGLRAGVEMGSFGRIGTDAEFGARTRDVEIDGSVRYGTAENNFPFGNRVRPGLPTERRINADYTNWGGLGRLSLRTVPLRFVARIDGVERGAPGRMGSQIWDLARWRERAVMVGASLGPLEDERGRRITVSWSRRDQRYADGRVGRSEALRADQVVVSGEDALPSSIDLTWRLTWAAADGDALSGQSARASGGLRAARTFDISPAWATDLSMAFDVAAVGVAVSPTLGLSWGATEATRLWARAGQAYRLPTFGDMFLRSGSGAVPNPDLRPERVVLDAEIGTDYHDREHGVRVGGASFFRHTRDPIVWLPSVIGVWSPINGGRLTAYGLEARFGWTPIADWSVSVTGTLQESRLGFDDYSNPLPYHAPVSGVVSLERSRSGSGIRADLEVQGARRTSVYGPHSLPPFSLLNLRANQRFHALGVEAVLEVGLLNVLDVAYERTELFPEPGRSVEVRVELRQGTRPSLQSNRVGRSFHPPAADVGNATGSGMSDPPDR